MEWILAGTLISLAAGGIGLLIRSVRLRRELAELRSHLEVFTEASIRVADSLDELMRGNVDASCFGPSPNELSSDPVAN